MDIVPELLGYSNMSVTLVSYAKVVNKKVVLEMSKEIHENLNK